MSDQPPRQDDVDETINEESEVDESSLESFPASDPPGLSGTYSGRDDESDSEDETE